MSESAPRRPRREQTATEALLSIVLLLEAILFFFVTLVVFALRSVPAPVAFGGGAAFFVIFLVMSRLMRHRWAVGLGWVLQAVLIGTGILQPLMYVIGAGFVAIWIYCFIRGRQLDARNAAAIAQFVIENSTPDPTNQSLSKENE